MSKDKRSFDGAGSGVPSLGNPELAALPAGREWITILLAAVALALLTAWLAAPAIHFGFIYDDHAQIETNPEIQSWGNFGRLFEQPLWAQLGPERASPYYRPLFSAALLVQYMLFGPNPALWHGLSIGLHIAVSLALFLLLVLQTGRWLTALGAACLFATSPLTAEVSNWVSASDESLFTLLVLCAFCGLLLSARVRSTVQARILRVLSALALATALCAKETAVAGLIAAAFLELLVLRRARPRPYELLIPAGAVAVWWMLHPRIQAWSHRSFADVSAAQVYAGCLELRKLVWPTPISQFYDLWIGQYHSAGSLALHVMALALGAMLVIWAALRGRMVAWALLVVILPMGISLGGMRVFRDYDLVHDRYLYLPLCGVAMLIAEGMKRMERRMWAKNAALGLMGAMVCLQIAAYSSVSGQFRNDLEFFSNAVEVAPDNIVALQLLADTELRMKDCSSATGHFERAEQLQPDQWKTTFYMGIGYLQCGQMEAAGSAFRRAAAVSGARPEETALAWYELARLLVTEGHGNDARAAVSEAIRLDPGSRKARALQAELALSWNQ